MRTGSIFSIVLLLCHWQLQSQEIIRLDSKKAPADLVWPTPERSQLRPPMNTEVVSNVSEPTMTVFRPEAGKVGGASLIIAPGGGFHFLGMDPCIQLAKWCQEKGITAFVLKYRVYPTGEDPLSEFVRKVQEDQAKMDRELAPLIALANADGRAAVAYVRQHASDFGIDPTKIGILGFSAGGTLAASAALEHSKLDRPDFSAPIYGALHVLDLTQLPDDPMPLFVAVASDDNFGFQEQGVDIYRLWNRAGQPAELHVYGAGGHGFGMQAQGKTSDLWIDQFAAWLAYNGFLEK